MNRQRLNQRLRALERQQGETAADRLRARCDMLTSDEKRRRLAELMATGEARAKARIEAGEPAPDLTADEQRRLARMNELLAIGAARVAATGRPA